MKTITDTLRIWLSDEGGANVIEYALLAALIALAIITGAAAVGGQLNTLFTDIKEKFASIVP